MKIKKILNERRTISFEFFPPREADGVPAVIDVIKGLQQFSPDFVSVTYGAGGGTRAFTEEITMRLKAETSSGSDGAPDLRSPGPPPKFTAFWSGCKPPGLKT